MLKQQYTDEQILNAVKPTPTGTRDVALAVGCSRRTAGNRLEKLFEEGLINKYEVAAGGSDGKLYIWMREESEKLCKVQAEEIKELKRKIKELEFTLENEYCRRQEE